jgi:hypothetical protein
MAPQAEGSGAPKGANGAALAKRGARLAIGALASRRSTRLLSSKTQLESPHSVTGYAHKTRNRAGSSRPEAGCKSATGNRTRSMFGYASRTCPSMNERRSCNVYGDHRQESVPMTGTIISGFGDYILKCWVVESRDSHNQGLSMPKTPRKRKSRAKPPHPERDAAICARRKEGISLEQIGKQHGLSRPAVTSVLAKQERKVQLAQRLAPLRAAFAKGIKGK